jgi:hypothetical protein
MVIISGFDETGVYHVFEHPAAPDTLCGMDEYDIMNTKARSLESVEYDLCRICKRRLKEAAKLAYWKQHGSLAGFEATP